MPRYHFHIEDGRNIPDCEGIELQDDEEALRHAMEVGSDAVNALGEELWNGNLWQMKVVDETGRRIVTLRTRGHLQVHY